MCKVHRSNSEPERSKELCFLSVDRFRAFPSFEPGIPGQKMYCTDSDRVERD